MTFILFGRGRRFYLNFALGTPDAEETGITVMLYQSDYTPAVGDDGTGIVESTFPGYAAVTIAHGDFSGAAIVDDVAVSDAGTVPVYTCTGGAGQMAYGVAIVENSGGEFIGAGRFDEPLNMIPGAVITLTPFQGVLPLV